MQIADEQTIEIKEVSDFVTVLDTPDQPENLALATRGFRHGRDGMIAERDYGTQHRYAANNYPVTNLAAPAVTIVGGRVLYDKDHDLDCEFVVGLDSANNMHVFVYDTAWHELTEIYTAQVDALAGGDGIYTANMTGAQKDGRAVTLSGNELGGFIGVKASAIAGCYTAVPIGASSGIQVTSTCTPLGPDGGEWAEGDTITFYQSAALREFVAANGTSPNLAWLETEAQRKVVMAYGDSNTPVGTQYPVRYMRSGQRKYFFTGATTALMTLPTASGDRWYSEKGGGLIEDYKDLGVVADELVRSSVISEWLMVTVQSTKTIYVANPNVYCYYYITVQYGHQESDPVMHYGVGFNQVSDISTEFNFIMNPGFMPKDVTGFNVYRATKVVDATLPLPTIVELAKATDEEYFLAKYLPITEYDAALAWALSSPVGAPATGATYTLTGTYTNTFLTEEEADDSVLQTLAHALMFDRSRIKPRYMTRAGRDQGTIVAADKSDNEVVFTTIDGTNTHNEDNFVNRATDIDGHPQNAYLVGKGELFGLGMHTMNLLAFRRSEIEVFDLQSGQRDFVPADVCSKRSILQVNAPRGTAWAGRSGLYFLPEEGSGQQLLNRRWINFYNGDLKLPGTDTPYVTDAAREAIITGYNPFYGELWFQILVNKVGGGTEYLSFRYNLEQKRWWCVRKLNIGTGPDAVKYFTSRKDKTLTIGYGAGLLKYPVQAGTLKYEDDVSSAGVTAGKGIESELTLHLGSLYSQLKKTVLTRVKIDHAGASVDATGTYQFDLYANEETSSIFTTPKLIPLDSRCKVRTIRRRGRLERIRLKISLAAASLTNTTRLDISTIALSFVKRNMIGRR